MGPHGAALAIVIAAFALLLLRPFCDLAFAAADHGHVAPAAAMAGYGVAGHADSETPKSETCCAMAWDESLVNPAELLSQGLPEMPLGAVLFLLAALPLFAGSRRSLRFCLAVPPERSFYARSARILR